MGFGYARPKGGFAPFLLLGLLVFPGFAVAGASEEIESDRQTAAPPARVLFVGNSFTYYNDSLHKHYRNLVRVSGIHEPNTTRSRIMTISGARLPEHVGGFEPVLSGDDWDVVVMQGHSLGPISEDTAGPFREAARKFASIARGQGTRPVFFMTWAYTDRPEMTAQLDAAYTTIGRELDAEVVPVGLAFARATAERPELALRIDDARHPSLAGTYLAACTFFAAFYDRSPEGLTYDAGLGTETARYLKQVAWQTVEAYRQREAEWLFSSWDGPPVPVRSYVPAGSDATTPIVFVMHGASRDAPRYYADWKAAAAAGGFIAVVPYLSKEQFPGAQRFNLGNVMDAETKRQRARDEWTFSLIEPLFDEVVRRIGGEQTGYVLYGHSAGSQFVHRFMYYVPDARASRFVAANAGWYTMPDFGVEYPYGLKNAGIDAELLPGILARPLVLLLGQADNDPQANKLRKTPEAEQQGPNRLERGRAMYRAGKARAAELGVDFNWQLQIVAGADHDNAKMTPAAAALVK